MDKKNKSKKNNLTNNNLTIKNKQFIIENINSISLTNSYENNQNLLKELQIKYKLLNEEKEKIKYLLEAEKKQNYEKSTKLSNDINEMQNIINLKDIKIEKLNKELFNIKQNNIKTSTSESTKKFIENLEKNYNELIEMKNNKKILYYKTLKINQFNINIISNKFNENIELQEELKIINETKNKYKNTIYILHKQIQMITNNQDNLLNKIENLQKEKIDCENIIFKQENIINQLKIENKNNFNSNNKKNNSIFENIKKNNIFNLKLKKLNNNFSLPDIKLVSTRNNSNLYKNNNFSLNNSSNNLIKSQILIEKREKFKINELKNMINNLVDSMNNENEY